jgi:formylglycine-generating enzyme required for sulfatase activity
MSARNKCHAVMALMANALVAMVKDMLKNMCSNSKSIYHKLNFIWIVSIVLLCLLFTANAQYVIPSFNTGARTIPPSGNDIIIPFEGTTLKQVPSAPALKSGEVLLRRRFSATEYGLFIGRMNEKAYSRLSAFRIQQSGALSSNIVLKFYSQQVTNPDLDMANVYFDNDLVYVENAAKLFYNDGVWQSLAMQTLLPSRLTITSEPPGAAIFIDGAEKGITPYYGGAVFQPSAVVQIKKDGYYIQEDFVDLEGKGQVTKDFTLSKKLSFSNGAEIDAQAYTAENTESIDEIEQRISDLERKAEMQKAENKSALEDFEKKYPALQPKGEFEKQAAFEEREKKYAEQKATEKSSLETGESGKINTISDAIEKVKTYKATIEDRTYQRYYSTDGLRLSQYESEGEYFPVSMEIKEGEFDFTFYGTLKIPIDVAPDFKQKLGDGRLSLSYKNKAIVVSVNGRKTKRFYEFTGIKLRFREKDYDMEGKFTLPGYVTSSKEYREYQSEMAEEARKAEAEKARFAEEKRAAEAAKKAEERLTKDMVYVEGGTFMMGDYDKHSVTVNSFYIQKTEVTQAQWMAIMGNNPSRFIGDDLPVEQVNWSDCQEYIRKLNQKTGGNYRLPTEAEWEYAARGGNKSQGYTYSGSNNIDEVAWYGGNSGNRTQWVGTKGANELGIYDMSGNVSEWCSDWYDENYYKTSPSENPQGPATGSYRVFLGGSWLSNAAISRVAYRHHGFPYIRNFGLGFRPVLSSNRR